MEQVALSDHETAEAIRDGKLKSPQKYGDFWLFALRVTGTGVAYRDSIDEYAIRDPKAWLSDEFVTRCNGLAVVDGHPPGRGVDTEWYREHAIGNVVLPYISGDEVWGVAKIFDAKAAEEMQSSKTSTSPGVKPPEDSIATETKDGTKVLAEDLPLVLDHLAICPAGVWDKNGPPEGVRLDSRKADEVPETEEEKKALEKANKERDDAMARADAAEKERDDGKRRMDAMEKDARRARHDCPRMDGESEEMWDKRKKDARKDESEEERKDREEREDAKSKKDAKDKKDESDKEAEKKAKELAEHEETEQGEHEKEDSKKDGASTSEVDVEKGIKIDARNDSVMISKDQWAQVQEMQRQMAALTRPLSNDERDAISAMQYKADIAFQKVGDEAPRHMQGESPSAFRRRIMARGQKYTRFKDQTAVYFHDATAVEGPALDLLEQSFYKDLDDYAKNPPESAKLLGLRPVVEQRNGKTYTSFIGDSKETWAPFQHPSRRFIRSLKPPPGYVAPALNGGN